MWRKELPTCILSNEVQILAILRRVFSDKFDIRFSIRQGTQAREQVP
jgi:hypothetical protein